MAKVLPDVYIIESLDPDDEGNGRFEGVFLSHVLRLHGKQPKYQYVRTRDDFEEAVQAFGDSNYRYLHLSCHGNREGLVTTNQEEIDFEELSDMLNPPMKGRRLFSRNCIHRFRCSLGGGLSPRLFGRLSPNDQKQPPVKAQGCMPTL